MSDTSETLKQTARRLDHHEGPRPLPEIIVEFQDHLELTTGRWWDTEVAEIFSALPRQRKVFTAGNIGQYRRRHPLRPDNEEAYVREWVEDLGEENVKKILGDVQFPFGAKGPKVNDRLSLYRRFGGA